MFPKPSPINDMPRETENKRREIIERFGAAGVITGARMFDEFRAMIIASLTKELPEKEFKKQLFERIYGAPMEDFLSGAIDDSKVRR